MCLAEIVELDLMNWPASAANQSSTQNTPSANITNNTVTVVDEGATVATAAPQGPTVAAPAPAKREINLRNWFTSSSSSSSAVAAAAASSSAGTGSPGSASSAAAAAAVGADQEANKESVASGSPNASVAPSMNKQKSGRGKIIGDSSLKSIGSKVRDRAQPTEAQLAQEHQPQKIQQPKEKSSRRTTSLLNLFMSNSQGMIIILFVNNLFI